MEILYHLFLLFIVFLLLFYPVIYISKLEFFKKNKKYKIILYIVFLLLGTIFFFIDELYTIGILSHVMIIFFVVNFICFLIRKIFSFRVSRLIQIIIVFTFSTIYLTIGYYNAVNVVRTYYSFDTNKDIIDENIRIALISDSHIGLTISASNLKDSLDRIKKDNPDMLVITGDFVDDRTSKKDMIESVNCFKDYSFKYGIYYIDGNHDKGYFSSRGFTIEELYDEFNKNGVTILKDDVININDNVYLVGREDKSYKNRKSFDSLIEAIDNDKYIITLDHQPNDYNNELGSDLVLSGHTHGGQIWPLGPISSLFHINDLVYGTKRIDNTDFVVTSGISEWGLKFKTFTKSEYVIIDINKK